MDTGSIMGPDTLQYNYFSDISARPVDWLWFPYIPFGKVTILQGDPGEGKSTFMINLASIVSCGRAFPDGARLQGSITTIYQCAEDSREDTIKPRLIQAGADCSRIAFIDDGAKSLTLTDSRLEEAVVATGARLLILDPIQAFIGQDCDMQSATSMRTAMRSLALMAERRHCAVVLVGHMNKGTAGKALYRGLGSIDIAAIARSVLMIMRDCDNPSIRYMVPVKASLAAEGSAIGFLFDQDRGFQWIGRCERNRDMLGVRTAIGRSKRERAGEMLRLLLSVDDLPSVVVFQRMEQLGFSEKTVKNAKKDAEIEAYRKAGAWYWRLSHERSDEE